ncbi:PREDICTED: spermatogenesis-associated protein 31C2-like [Galeopterus variegatus]|uniref:Spermatogenesis-associated protein 31C2-like n=1 Tax=Galeopterus variegatus TaxID=482537 RepID=A0ABM0Q2Y4_GALVR|nr:PREDICTED: spermatogenesis-associated protein 31C2-like [Galeopterus variegatus]
MVKNPQEAFSQLTPDSGASQENESVSLLPEDFISPELREQLEKHLQQRYTQRCCGLSPRLHVSPDLIQPQDEFPGTSRVNNRHESSVFVGGSS